MQRPLSKFSALQHPLLWLLPGMLWGLWLIYASLAPVPKGMDLPSDKLLHIASYAILVFLLACAVKPRLVPLLLILAASLGLCLEFLQGMIPYRSFEWSDGLANLVGAVVGGVVAITPAGRLFSIIETLVYRPVDHG